MVSIIPVLGIQAGFVLSGAVYIEKVFEWPGVGRMLVDAILKRDYPLVLGSLYVFSLIGLLTKLFTDIAYTWVDPRVKFSGNG